MKIIDTTTYFEEKLMMEVRFNILDPYVDHFVVCESLFSHSGKKKKINFNKNDYQKFSKKIEHIIVENEPDDIIKNKSLNNVDLRLNSISRIRHQRNFIKSALKKFSDEDLIIYSDNDEIPDLSNIDLSKIKEKILIFNQKLFYYKFNLLLDNVKWFGSKACQLRNLKSIDELRATKNKKYSFFRLDTYFSNIKHRSLKIIDKGGWHFSNLKKPDDLEKKYLNDENHSEYEQQNIDLNRISKNIKERVINYNHSAKKNSKDRFNRTKLSLANLDILPKYLKDNFIRYKNWIDED
jgi:beta-1,4-mannosyl-glycoprotein beta-1,4-N-acetylglucosaminyltransferase